VQNNVCSQSLSTYVTLFEGIDNQKYYLLGVVQ